MLVSPGIKCGVSVLWMLKSRHRAPSALSAFPWVLGMSRTERCGGVHAAHAHAFERAHVSGSCTEWRRRGLERMKMKTIRDFVSPSARTCQLWKTWQA